MTCPQTLVFTDLDGTLLDAVSYSFAAALPALAELRARQIPLILCSSKTRAEIELWRQRLDNRHPFISENGGGVYIPRGYFTALVEGAESLNGCQVVAFGTPHAEIRRQFVALRTQLGTRVRGFTDMSVTEVAQLTGLDLASAALARQRDFDEPFVFEGAPDPVFLKAIQGLGLNWTQGHLFHMLGRHDKGRAVRLLKALYLLEFGRVNAIGLGDALNDLPMLQAVDQPVLVRHANGQSQKGLDCPRLVRTEKTGVQGWNDVVLQRLSQTSHAAVP